MIAVPYLVLFFIALGLQIAFYKNGAEKMCTAGHIVGAACGLYVAFMIWLWAGFGESSSYRVFATINGRPLYLGGWSLFPVVVFGCMLMPGVSWLTRWIAYMLTHFITEEAKNASSKTHPATGNEAIFGWLFLGFFYACIGFLPFFLIIDGAHYSKNFIAYLDSDFVQFSFCSMILTVWLLFGIRVLANGIVSRRAIKKKRQQQ